MKKVLLTLFELQFVLAILEIANGALISAVITVVLGVSGILLTKNIFRK